MAFLIEEKRCPGQRRDRAYRRNAQSTTARDLSATNRAPVSAPAHFRFSAHDQVDGVVGCGQPVGFLRLAGRVLLDAQGERSVLILLHAWQHRRVDEVAIDRVFDQQLALDAIHRHRPDRIDRRELPKAVTVRIDSGLSAPLDEDCGRGPLGIKEYLRRPRHLGDRSNSHDVFLRIRSD
jgi:hypothetical protein